MRYFLDTEFIENGSTIDLISIGIVAEDGRELYIQLEAKFTEASDWVARNVFPHLRHFHMLGRRLCKAHEQIPTDGRCFAKDCPWRDRREARGLIMAFCDPEKYGRPEFWADYGSYDWVALCQLFGTMMALPKGWPMFVRDIQQLREEHDNADLPTQPTDAHDALEDARWVRVLWTFLMSIGADEGLVTGMDVLADRERKAEVKP